MADRLGTQVGNYRLTQLLGQGGFAEVYLGEHVHLGTRAAIKLLHAPLASASEIDKFQQEARTIAKLQHPHILRVLEFGIDAGQPYLVLEQAPGGSLRERHPSGTQVPLATVVSYVQQVAQALQYAHDQKLIHRDIKPQNLLVGRNGEILLSDFGISVVAESTSRQQAQGFAGTVAYSAPEQLQEHPRPASDQYALGVVVYEWLCGCLPFTGALGEVAAKHLLAAPPSLCEQLLSLPPAVEQVVLTALAKDPKDRFSSVSAFAKALEQASTTTMPAHQVVTPAPSTPPMDDTGEDKQASPSAVGAFTTNLVTPPAAPNEPLPTTGQRTAEANKTPAEAGVSEALSGHWQQVSAPPHTMASTRTLLPPLPAPVPVAPHPLRPEPPRKQLMIRVLTAGILLFLLVGGSLVGLGLVGSGPFSGLGVKASATSTRQMAPTATATPLPAGTITEFALFTSNSRPWEITAGPDGNVWFTEENANKIGRITPTGTITEFAVPTTGSGLVGITAGPDGNVWFTEENANKIGRITLQGAFTEFPLPTSNRIPGGTSGGPEEIRAGPDGNLWFTNAVGGKVGRITPGGTITEFDVGGYPVGIAAGPDDNLWFTDYSGNQIGRITPGGTITEFALPASRHLGGITAGPDGNLWFIEWLDNKIGRITPSGTITEFDVLTPNNHLGEITAGPDGNVWFAEHFVNQIGRITPSGTITEFAVPTPSSDPLSITAGPDGNLWFTEVDGNKIGRITTGQ